MKHSITYRALVICLLWLMLVSAAAAEHPGALISLGTHKLHAVTTPGKRPLVVFEAGGGAYSAYWYGIQERVSQALGHATLSYDRAGLGWSDARNSAYSIDDDVDDLDKLLSALDVNQPVVLVGHSYGGWVAKLFAARNPQRVAGLVLVDSNSAHFFEQYPARTAAIVASAEELPPRGIRRLSLRVQRGWLARRTGLAKKYFDPILTDRHQRALRAMLRAFDQTTTTLAMAHLPDIPTIQISRGKAENGFPWGDAAAESAWRSGHEKQIAHLSTQQIWIAEQSGHAVIVDQPDIVVAAIEAMLAQRDEHPLVTPGL